MGNKHLNAEENLYLIAESQQGYFTARQAIDAGFQDATHPYHVRTGHWIREGRGIYRLARYPLSPDSEYVRWALWTRNRQGEVLGIYSHETALSMYELSDINPSKIHISIPRGFRRHSRCPEVLVLHTNEIPDAEIQEREGYRVAKPFRTIRDLLEEGKVSLEFIEQATRQSVVRGLVTSEQVKKIGSDFPEIKELVKDLL